MRKLLGLIVVAAGGYYAWKKYQQKQLDEDLWAQATDLVD